MAPLMAPNSLMYLASDSFTPCCTYYCYGDPSYHTPRDNLVDYNSDNNDDDDMEENDDLEQNDVDMDMDIDM